MPGNDLLSRALRQSTIGAEDFHCRVRDGIECILLAIATRQTKYKMFKNTDIKSLMIRYLFFGQVDLTIHFGIEWNFHSIRGV